VVKDAEGLLVAYRDDDGLRCLDLEPITPPNRLVPEDLAVTILINTRVNAAAFKSVQDRAGELDLAPLPDASLENTSDMQREELAQLVSRMAAWPGFAASVATKILHKKRPALIPILDNQAVFGAYMNPSWPERRSYVRRVRVGVHDGSRAGTHAAPGCVDLREKRARLWAAVPASPAACDPS